MSALKHLLDRYNEGDKLTDLETLVVIARDETAAEELNAMREELRFFRTAYPKAAQNYKSVKERELAGGE